MKTKDIIKDIYTCAACGYCRFGCPVNTHVGFESATARGRMLIVKKILEGKLGYTNSVVDSIYMCSQCANCSEICPTGIKYVDIITALRQELFQRGLYPESQKMLRSIISEHGNPFSGKKEERSSWLPEEHKTPRKSKNVYFVGCSSSYASNRIARSIMKVLDTIGFDYTVLGSEEYCCGDPLRRMGEQEEASLLMEKNVEKFKEFGIKTVIASCAGCYKSLKHNYPQDFEMLHVTQLFDRLIKEGKLKFTKELKNKIIYQDGCDLGRHCGIYEEPRNILRAIPGVELLEFDYCKEEAICCGGPLASGYLDLSHKIAADRVREANAKGADMIATSCPMCFVHLKDGAKEASIVMSVQDIPLLLLKAI